MSTMQTRLAGLAVAGTLFAGAAAVAVATATDAGAAVPACGNNSLAVTRAPGDAASGHRSFDLLFRNVSHAACTLYGYPGLDALDRSGHVMAHARRTLSGYMGGPGVVRLVSVAPGRFAAARVEWLAFNPITGANCPVSVSVATTPANTTHTVRLPVSVSICQLQVHPTVAGTDGNGAFAAAQVQWIAGSTSISAYTNKYLLAAENDLKAAGNEFATQIAELEQLISIPETNASPAQIAEAHHDITALNTFFGTPGLYL